MALHNNALKLTRGEGSSHRSSVSRCSFVLAASLAAAQLNAVLGRQQ